MGKGLSELKEPFWLPGTSKWYCLWLILAEPGNSPEGPFSIPERLPPFSGCSRLYHGKDRRKIWQYPMPSCLVTDLDEVGTGREPLGHPIQVSCISRDWRDDVRIFLLQLQKFHSFLSWNPFEIFVWFEKIAPFAVKHNKEQQLQCSPVHTSSAASIHTTACWYGCSFCRERMLLSIPYLVVCYMEQKFISPGLLTTGLGSAFWDKQK